MTATLKAARASADALKLAFDTACTAAGYPDEWAAFRAEVAGVTWPAALDTAHRAWLDALHGFFNLRDGPAGFLGSRGV